MADKYKGPDSSDIAESMASGAATGAIAPMVKSMQSRMSKFPRNGRQNEILWTSDGKDRFDSYEKMDSARRNKVANTPMAPKEKVQSTKLSKKNIRKSYPE